MVIKEHWAGDASLPGKIFATPVLAMVELIEAFDTATGWDSMLWLGERREKGDQWDKDHPVGAVFKHLTLGTAKALAGYGARSARN